MILIAEGSDFAIAIKKGAGRPGSLNSGFMSFM